MNDELFKPQPPMLPTLGGLSPIPTTPANAGVYTAGASLGGLGWVTMTFAFDTTQTLQLIVAQEAVKNLWSMTKYLNLYREFETGGISKETFTLEAERFAEAPLNRISADQIRFCVTYLRHLLPDLEPEFVPDILRVDDEAVDNALAGVEQ